MLSEREIGGIREHLERAQNPIFYYDNDADGICSYVLLRKFIGRGKGVAVRSFPDLNAGYARKAQELNADYVFVLDKPILSLEFLDEIQGLGLPIVWIDHHDVENEDFSKVENFYVYNPAKKKGKDKSDEPVTYLCYKIADRMEDMWLALIGCIADHYMPEFSKDFGKRYGEFWGKGIKGPFDAYYRTELGRIARAINFGLKDSISNVVRLQNFLISCQSPGDVFQEIATNRAFRKKYQDVEKKYNYLVEKAKKNVEGEILFFEYGGEVSLSADVSNYLSYIYPGKYIVVAYKNGSMANLSIRGKGVRKILEKVLEGFEGASGGGHEDAVGARLKTEDLGKLKDRMREEIKK